MARPPEFEEARRDAATRAAEALRERAPELLQLQVVAVDARPAAGAGGPRVASFIALTARVVVAYRSARGLAPGNPVHVHYLEWEYPPGATGAMIYSPERPRAGRRVLAWLAAAGATDGGALTGFVPAADFLSFAAATLLGDFELLVLLRLARAAESLPALRQSVAAYPENIPRDGAVIPSLTAYLAPFADLDQVRAALAHECEGRGGFEALEGQAEAMDFDEFLYGQDER